MHDTAYGAASACVDTCQGRTMNYYQLLMQPQAISIETVYQTKEEVHTHHDAGDLEIRGHYS